MKPVGQVPGKVAVLIDDALGQLQELVGGVRRPPFLQVAILVVVPA